MSDEKDVMLDVNELGKLGIIPKRRLSEIDFMLSTEQTESVMTDSFRSSSASP